jgi:hypothetical protein
LIPPESASQLKPFLRQRSPLTPERFFCIEIQGWPPSSTKRLPAASLKIKRCVAVCSAMTLKNTQGGTATRAGKHGGNGGDEACHPKIHPTSSVESEEMVALWEQLDAAGRADLIAVARGLVANRIPS